MVRLVAIRRPPGNEVAGRRQRAGSIRLRGEPHRRLTATFLVLLTFLLAACTTVTPVVPHSPTSSPPPTPTLPVATATSIAVRPTFPPTISPPFHITVAPTLRPTATPPRSEDWAMLRRPLTLPTVAPGAPCPRTPGASVSPHFGPGLGNGPAYPIMPADAVYPFGDLQPTPEGWYELKILWVAAPTYDGPVLVRGQRLDGPQGLLLSTSATGGDPPRDELRLFASNTLPQDGWRNWPSYTLIQAPGCYAYQIDGTTFTYTLVFQATPTSP